MVFKSTFRQYSVKAIKKYLDERETTRGRAGKQAKLRREACGWASMALSKHPRV